MSSLFSVKSGDFYPLNVLLVEGASSSDKPIFRCLGICHLSMTPSVETAQEEGKYLSQVLFGSDVIVAHTDQAKPSISLIANALEKIWKCYFLNVPGQALIQSFYGNGCYSVSLALERSPYSHSITVIGMDSSAVLQCQNAFCYRSIDQVFHYEKEGAHSQTDKVSTVQSIFNPIFIPGLQQAFRETLTKKHSQPTTSEVAEEWSQACLRAVTNMGWACLRVSEYAQLMLFYDRSREAVLQLFDKHRQEVLEHGHQSNFSVLFKGGKQKFLQTLEVTHRHYGHLEVLASFWLMQSIVHAVTLIINPLEFRWRRIPFLLTTMLVMGSVGDILENIDFILQKDVLPATSVILHGGLVAYSGINLLNEGLHLAAHSLQKRQKRVISSKKCVRSVDVRAANAALSGVSLLIAGVLGCIAHINSPSGSSGAFSIEDFFLIGKVLIIIELFWATLKLL